VAWWKAATNWSTSRRGAGDRRVKVTAELASRRIAIASVLIGVGLAVAKITIGLRAHSTATVSDGIESAGDVLTSCLVLLGLVIAAKPADADHPYGHGRLETISALVVGMILAASGVLISFESLHLAHGSSLAPSAYAVWPLLASIAIKSVMSAAKLRFARKIGSSALAADGWNDTVDIFSGCTALLGLGITLLDPERFSAADRRYRHLPRHPRGSRHHASAHGHHARPGSHGPHSHGRPHCPGCTWH
jgi:cation diffusion facilitator family transporter